MELDIILKELRKDNWLTGVTFIEDNREYLQALVDKTEEKLRLCGVGVNEATIPENFIGGHSSNKEWVEPTGLDLNSEVESCPYEPVNLNVNSVISFCSKCGRYHH